MRRKRLAAKLYPALLLIAVFSIIAVSWYAARILTAFETTHSTADMLSRAHLIQHDFSRLIASGSTQEVDALCKSLGPSSGTRITIILPTGTVIGDSDELPAVMENHATRPEIKAAFSGGTGTSIRYSATLHRKMVYAAIPLMQGSDVVAVVRTAFPLFNLQQDISVFRKELAIGGVVLLLLIGLGSYFIARHLSRPLEEMRLAAERFAEGHLEGRVPIPDTKEMAELAETLNSLAAQLGEKIDGLERQRAEQEVVFSNMTEGIIVIDPEERVVKINEAASVLFGIQREQAVGRSVQEVIRNTPLQKLLLDVLKSSESVEADVTIHNRMERHLQAHGTALRGASGDALGAMVVLNDVTRLRKLENLRRDFVANVSHELKTPITSIKGFVETLLDGAMNNPEETKRFLGIIAKHSERLNGIIEDLLSLSRIEQDTESRELRLEPARIKDVLKAAAMACEAKASTKQISIQIRCPDELMATVSAALLEQAVVNLVDNAVKYSDGSKSVSVEAKASGSELVIAVQDAGCGIPPEHLPRLFERFYRADKARSRQLGGTGLGLSIVKHIAQAHGGSVAVESTVGQGSTFTVRIPLLR